jgi:hypothetical protein
VGPEALVAERWQRQFGLDRLQFCAEGFGGALALAEERFVEGPRGKAQQQERRDDEKSGAETAHG